MFTHEQLLEILPHGSGVDCDWHFQDTATRTKCSNSFHVMNDVGMYVGYADFTLEVPFTDPLGFALHFQEDSSRYLARRYGLREYLEDLFAEALREMVKKHS